MNETPTNDLPNVDLPAVETPSTISSMSSMSSDLGVEMTNIELSIEFLYDIAARALNLGDIVLNLGGII